MELDFTLVLSGDIFRDPLFYYELCQQRKRKLDSLSCHLLLVSDERIKTILWQQRLVGYDLGIEREEGAGARTKWTNLRSTFVF